MQYLIFFIVDSITEDMLPAAIFLIRMSPNQNDELLALNVFHQRVTSDSAAAARWMMAHVQNRTFHPKIIECLFEIWNNNPDVRANFAVFIVVLFAQHELKQALLLNLICFIEDFLRVGSDAVKG